MKTVLRTLVIFALTVGAAGACTSITGPDYIPDGGSYIPDGGSYIPDGGS